MLFTLILCILLLYLPPAGGGLPASLPVLGACVGALAALTALAGWAASGLALRLARQRARWADVLARRVFTALEIAVVGFVAVDVVVLKWPHLLARLLQGSVWGAFAYDFALVAPALLMLGTVMVFQGRFQRKRGRIALSLPRYVWLRFRVELAIVLVPWAALVLASAAAAVAFEGTPAGIWADVAASGAVIVLLVVFSPAVLRLIWVTSPLPEGALRERLRSFMESHSFRCRDILVWHTYRHLTNAGVVGPTPLLRYVVLSDSLLHSCTEDEVEGVFAHEVGHVKHHHLPFYLAFGLGFLCFYANLIDGLAGLGFVSPLSDVLALRITLPQAGVMIGFAALYWGLVFGYVSRRMELQADLFALRSSSDPEAFVTALNKLAALNRRSPRRGSWRHFSIRRRQQFLRRMAGAPAAAARFRRKLLAIQGVFGGALVLGALRLLLSRPELLGL